MEQLGSAEKGVDPSGCGALGGDSVGEGMDPLVVVGWAGLNGQQYQRAGLGIFVPRMNVVDRGPVLDQNRVHPLAEEPFGQLGIVPVGADEIAERTEHRVAEPFPGREEGLGRRGEAHPIALELFQRVAAGGELGQSFFGDPAFIALRRLALAGLGHQVPGPVRGGGGRDGIVVSIQGVPLGRVGPRLGLGIVLGQASAVGLLLGQGLPQRREIAFQGGPFALEGPKRLRLGMAGFLQAADFIAMTGEAKPDFLLDPGPVGQILVDLEVLVLGQGEVVRSLVALEGCLLGPQLHLLTLFLIALPASPRVGQPFSGDGKVAVEFAEGQLHGGQFARHDGAALFGLHPLPPGAFLPLIGEHQPLARIGERRLEQVVARLHPAGSVTEFVEEATSQGQLNRELLLRELGMALRLALLARQAPNLRLHLGEQILEPLEIGGGFFEPALGGVLPVAIQADPRRFLEQ